MGSSNGVAPINRGFISGPGSRGDVSWIPRPPRVARSMVCTPLCNHFPVYYHHALKLIFSIAHTVPHGAGRLHPRNAHILRPRPRPGYPAPTTSLNSHVIYAGPQLLIEERPEAYQSIQGVVDVAEKRTAEGVCVLRPL